MEQGGETDPFGGTRDGWKIHDMLNTEATDWVNSTANHRRSPPPGPGTAPDDAGSQYAHLPEIFVPTVKPSISRYVKSERQAQPYFVTYREDPSLAFFDPSNTQQRPEFGQSIIPMYEDTVHSYQWLIENGAQIFDDPNTVERAHTQEIRRLTARLIKDRLVVDLTRIDTFEPGRQTRLIYESYRDGFSEVDQIRGRHPRITVRDQKPPADFHKQFSIDEGAEPTRAPHRSNTSTSVGSGSGGTIRGGLICKFKDVVLGHGSSRSQRSSTARGDQGGKGTRGNREEWIEQEAWHTKSGERRRRYTRKDKGNVYWNTGDVPESWRSDFKSGTNNLEEGEMTWRTPTD